MIAIIAAMTKNRVVGVQGGLPWQKLKADLRHFKEITVGHPVVMGRNTYFSLPERFRPLPDRTNIILTKEIDFEAPGCKLVTSLEEAVETGEQEGTGVVFMIGGGEVFRQTIGKADLLYLTEVDTVLEGDTFFPEVSSEEWELTDSKPFEKDEGNQFGGVFKTYRRRKVLV